MRLVLDIPEWAKGARILVFAGLECLADYNPADKTGYMFVKENRCVRCGSCCRQLKPTRSWPHIRQNGDCVFLIKEVGKNDRWLCDLGSDRSIMCGMDPRSQKECSITHRLVKVEDD